MKRSFKILILILWFSAFACQTEESALSEVTRPEPFKKTQKPVWTGTYVAGDPSVIRVGDSLRMYYTAPIPAPGSEEKNLKRQAKNPQIASIALATSPDGLNWNYYLKNSREQNPETIVMKPRSGQWDEVLETSCVIRKGGQYYMYYSGYSNNQYKDIGEGDIGLARSTNGLNFDRFLAGPVLERTPDYDESALFSPAVIDDQDRFYMIYTGWCLDCNENVQDYGLLSAYSEDGVRWTKTGEKVLTSEQVPWGDNPMDAALAQGPDKAFYLCFAAELGDGTVGLGLARAEQPFGPWQVYEAPVLVPDMKWEGQELMAPSLMIENGKFRIWYMGVVGDFEEFAVGYAEADWPLDFPMQTEVTAESKE